MLIRTLARWGLGIIVFIYIAASHVGLAGHHGLPLWGTHFRTFVEDPVKCNNIVYTTLGSSVEKACAPLPPIETTCKDYLVIPEFWVDRLLSWFIHRSPNVHVCRDKVRPRGKCIVYWFGVGQEWGGPQQMVVDLGCDVYAYDPDPQPQPVPKGVHYEQIGIGGETGIHKGTSTTYSGQTEYKIESLASLLKRNGHDGENKVDILRIDTEGAEYDMFATLDGQVLSHFGQLLMEVHSNSLADNMHGSSTDVCNVSWFNSKAIGAGAKLETFHAAHNCHRPGHVMEIGWLINGGRATAP